VRLIHTNNPIGLGLSIRTRIGDRHLSTKEDLIISLLRRGIDHLRYRKTLC
jgi:hypothetical protein